MNPAFKKGAPSPNPSGRKPKTEEERAGENFLRERTKAAAERLVELESSADEKVALGAVQTHLKITLGELERRSGADGVTAESPFVGLTHEQLAAIALHQLEKIEAAAMKPVEPDE